MVMLLALRLLLLFLLLLLLTIHLLLPFLTRLRRRWEFHRRIATGLHTSPKRQCAFLCLPARLPAPIADRRLRFAASWHTRRWLTLFLRLIYMYIQLFHYLQLCFLCIYLSPFCMVCLTTTTITNNLLQCSYLAACSCSYTFVKYVYICGACKYALCCKCTCVASWSTVAIWDY